MPSCWKIITRSVKAELLFPSICGANRCGKIRRGQCVLSCPVINLLELLNSPHNTYTPKLICSEMIIGHEKSVQIRLAHAGTGKVQNETEIKIRRERFRNEVGELRKPARYCSTNLPRLGPAVPLTFLGKKCAGDAEIVCGRHSKLTTSISFHERQMPCNLIYFPSTVELHNHPLLLF